MLSLQNFNELKELFKSGIRKAVTGGCPGFKRRSLRSAKENATGSNPVGSINFLIFNF